MSNITKLQNYNVDIVNKIIDEEDPQKTKNLISLFNNTQIKRGIARISKLNDILDLTCTKVEERLQKRGDELTNQELLQCLQVITNTIEKTNKELNNTEDMPTISLQQNNQINVNIAQQLPRESREKITDIINDIINRAKSKDYEILEDVEISEVKDDE